MSQLNTYCEREKSKVDYQVKQWAIVSALFREKYSPGIDCNEWN